MNGTLDDEPGRDICIHFIKEAIITNITVELYSFKTCSLVSLQLIVTIWRKEKQREERMRGRRAWRTVCIFHLRTQILSVKFKWMASLFKRNLHSYGIVCLRWNFLLNGSTGLSLSVSALFNWWTLAKELKMLISVLPKITTISSGGLLLLVDRHCQAFCGTAWSFQFSL